MSEYILREDAKKMLQERAHHLLHDLQEVETSEAVKDCVELVDELPAADVAPVVRCKDCKHYNSIAFECDYHEIAMFRTDYCSYGVSKGEAHD